MVHLRVFNKQQAHLQLPTTNNNATTRPLPHHLRTTTTTTRTLTSSYHPLFCAAWKTGVALPTRGGGTTTHINI